MARFTMDIGELNGNTRKTEDYLYKLQKQLEYMFSHLTPEDNYSDEAKAIYVSASERQASNDSSIAELRAIMVAQNAVINAINRSSETETINSDRVSFEDARIKGAIIEGSKYNIDSNGITIAGGSFSGSLNNQGATLGPLSIDASDAHIGAYAIAAALTDIYQKLVNLDARVTALENQ